MFFFWIRMKRLWRLNSIRWEELCFFSIRFFKVSSTFSFVSTISLIFFRTSLFSFYLAGDFSPKNIEIRQNNILNLKKIYWNYLQVALIFNCIMMLLYMDVQFRDCANHEAAALALMDQFGEVENQLVLHCFLNGCLKTTEWAEIQGRLVQ